MRTLLPLEVECFLKDPEATDLVRATAAHGGHPLQASLLTMALSEEQVLDFIKSQHECTLNACRECTNQARNMFRSH